MKTKHSLTNILIITFSLFTLVYLGGCVAGKQKMLDQGNKPLANMELKEIFAEKRVANGVNNKGNSFVVTYLPDGTQTAVGSNGKTYPGTYYLEGDKFCSKMDFRGGAVKCSTWFKVGDKKYQIFEDEGSGETTLNFQ